MPVETVGIFTIRYALVTNAAPGFDIQFGMDFGLTSTTGKPLAQLIFPATNVGTNLAQRWNIDNHARAGNDAAALVFPNAENGTINDPPREISRRNDGIKKTKFAVYVVEVDTFRVLSHGVTFGYNINTGDENPQATFTGFEASSITNEQKSVIQNRCPNIKFA
jgi:hypothetical protein